MVLTNSCREKSEQLQLLDSKTLEFPSASAIEFYQDKLYVLGDDAPYLLVLDTDYRPLDSFRYIDTDTDRLPKDTKPDIESCFIFSSGKQWNLLAIGSMSADNRFNNFIFSLSHRNHVEAYPIFSSHISFPLITQINIEGSAMVNGTMIFANRATDVTKRNHLLIRHKNDSITVIPVQLESEKDIIGISGLYYLAIKDILFFTGSVESTSDPLVDGPIGESYFGWIGNFSKKMNSQEIAPDRLMKLSAVHKEFSGHKIESVCVEQTSNEIIFHLVADNDDGSSKIFKLGGFGK